MPKKITKEKEKPQSEEKKKFLSVLKKDKKGRKLLEIKAFSKLNTLIKLRLVVTSIFALSTLSIILVTTSFVATVLLILLSYILVLTLMIKLFIIKKL